MASSGQTIFEMLCLLIFAVTISQISARSANVESPKIVVESARKNDDRVPAAATLLTEQVAGIMASQKPVVDTIGDRRSPQVVDTMKQNNKLESEFNKPVESSMNVQVRVRRQDSPPPASAAPGASPAAGAAPDASPTDGVPGKAGAGGKGATAGAEGATGTAKGEDKGDGAPDHPPPSPAHGPPSKKPGKEEQIGKQQATMSAAGAGGTGTTASAATFVVPSTANNIFCLFLCIYVCVNKFANYNYMVKGDL